MPRRNSLVFMAVLLIFVLSALIVFPAEKGVLFGKGVRLGLDLQGGTRIVYKADFTSVEPGKEGKAIDGAMSVLENRINPLGVSETSVQKLGANEILVEIPGRTLTDNEKESLGNVALLEFGEEVTGNETFKWENSEGRWKPATAVIDGVVKELTSRYFTEDASIRPVDTGGVELLFRWDAEGSKLSEIITGRLIGKRLGIFEGNGALIGENRRPIAPTVQSTIINSGVITGLSIADVTRLSKQLNAGRLPVPLERTGDEKSVEPWLGVDFVTKSVKAGILGVGVLMLFIIIYYRLSGLMASLALVYYGVLTLAIFKLFGFTLTLAGIGGFVLSIGMAIDANVLIFERLKEEMWDGKTLGAALEAGFRRAFSAIWDSNITTMLAGFILFWLGSSSIIASDMAKGFALTLIVGVAVSMFTAIVVTRTFLRLFVGTALARHTSLFAPYQRKKNV
ncbi:MAG: protein translocase subunit SecD [Chloroflexota bacterium]